MMKIDLRQWKPAPAKGINIYDNLVEINYEKYLFNAWIYPHRLDLEVEVKPDYTRNRIEYSYDPLRADLLSQNLSKLSWHLGNSYDIAVQLGLLPLYAYSKVIWKPGEGPSRVVPMGLVRRKD